MNLENYKKLEDKVKKPDFNKDYKGLNTILKILSILGNIASIFLASFFVTELLKVAIENEYIIWAIAIIALCGLELTKREIFFRFSRDFIRTNDIFSKNVASMLFFTMVLISLSFYSSLSGAKKFSSKSDKLENVAETNIKTYEDSLRNVYSKDIIFYDGEIKKIIKDNSELSSKISEEDNAWTRKKLQETRDDNNKYLTEYKLELESIKTERDDIIETYKKEVLSETSEDINKNQSDSYIFIATSTLIEFLILIGIYFNNIFNFKSYRDTKKRLLNDENFKTYYNYLEILELLFLNRKEKDKIPSSELLLELLDMNKVYITSTQLEQALKIFDALKIIETNGNTTYILKEKEEAEKDLKKHFHIK